MTLDLPPPPDVAVIRAQLLAETSQRRALWTPAWERVGRFSANPVTEWKGPRDYLLVVTDPLFAFTRANGNTITPGAMDTDAGSIPRVAWSIPGFDPWQFAPAYFVHDWCFEQHHRGTDVATFEDSNTILAEGIHTLIAAGAAPRSWFDVKVIFRAVGSLFGRAVWDHGTSGL